MKDQLIQALEWRYATKKFDATQQLDANDKETIERVLQLTPTSYGLQPLHFIWIEDGALREQIKTLAWNQQQIVDAASVLVLCAKKRPRHHLPRPTCRQHARHPRNG